MRKITVVLLLIIVSLTACEANDKWESFDNFSGYESYKAYVWVYDENNVVIDEFYRTLSCNDDGCIMSENSTIHDRYVIYGLEYTFIRDSENMKWIKTDYRENVSHDFSRREYNREDFEYSSDGNYDLYTMKEESLTDNITSFKIHVSPGSPGVYGESMVNNISGLITRTEIEYMAFDDDVDLEEPVGCYQNEELVDDECVVPDIFYDNHFYVLG